MIAADTIAALSTAAGPAARMVVRLSGPEALARAAELVARDAGGSSQSAAPQGSGDPGSRQPPSAGPAAGALVPGARRVHLHVKQMRVPAWLYVFGAPRSYTGEDVVELHLPGNPLLARLVLDELIQRGARQAEAGEFTARAYFNGRLDLAAAEGVAALVSATNERERRAARQLLAGELARRLTPLMDRLAETLALLEVEIDFSDEAVTFLERDEARARIEGLRAALQRLVDESVRFERLSHEPRIVLVGRPNAGKSTLLNALAGRTRAVVSPIAGTTRDVLSAEVDLPAGRVLVIDVAGIEDEAPAEGTRAARPAAQAEHLTDDQQPTISPALSLIEQDMRRRALQAVAEADVVVWVEALGGEPAAGAGRHLQRTPELVVRTKADLSHDAVASPAQVDSTGAQRVGRDIAISAWTGQGMDALRHRLSALAFGQAAGGSVLALNARHVQAIASAVVALDHAAGGLDRGAEVIALDLREALDALGSILGVVTPDELLGRIFSRFCIGK